MNRFAKRLNCISSLNDCWDGYGAIVPSKTVIDNALNFLKEIDKRGLSFLLDEEDIVPTPYGTIDIDFMNDTDGVYVEIGDTEIGYFTEFMTKENIASDSLPIEDESVFNVIAELKTIN